MPNWLHGIISFTIMMVVMAGFMTVSALHWSGIF